MAYNLNVNGRSMTVESDGDTPLLWALRDILGFKGTKFGCGVGLCGCCTVHIDGVATRACQTPIDSVGTSEIATIEGLATSDPGRRIQKAWLDFEVVQCGYCQPGQLMSAAALLTETPDPTDEDIDAAMSGNLCRCGTYNRIRDAIKYAAHLDATMENAQ
ncbi:(2Fe-2S)-binding protein [Sinorhizobium mexicanum]|uniref:(2Fe-2S)-binding protein n=1 Tax=Sinorhizobium mexicanum TaxID=375549 RepID=A0A859QMR1_9HYPH|nr:(2Fe-2S)-binding protein [Sinorhizobium mexicanum]MBP1881803.1 isoquinoline 1-oxidoreductase alpha subunit [Sinorhizobium mexicanum]QLL61556.1 (2Fe-2S)-binding protein [Sinorhizobium mexicanum]